MDWFTNKYNNSLAQVERDLVLFYAEKEDESESNWFTEKYKYSPDEASGDTISYREVDWELEEWFDLIYKHSLEEVEQDLIKYYDELKAGIKSNWFTEKYDHSPEEASGDARRYRILVDGYIEYANKLGLNEHGSWVELDNTLTNILPTHCAKCEKKFSSGEPLFGLGKDESGNQLLGCEECLNASQ